MIDLVFPIDKNNIIAHQFVILNILPCWINFPSDWFTYIMYESQIRYKYDTGYLIFFELVISTRAYRAGHFLVRSKINHNLYIVIFIYNIN